MAKKSKQITGTCRHCGQTRIIYIPDGKEPGEYTQEELDDTATEQCECEKAVTAEAKNRQKKEAVDRMNKYYNDIIAAIKPGQDEAGKIEHLRGRQVLMTTIIESVCDRDIAAAGIQLTAAEAFMVSFKSGGALKVKRTYKGAEEWIF